MPNLFISTRFDFPEEDRLTNALMAVLEHSDRWVLRRFLETIDTSVTRLSDDDAVGFDLQVAFKGSRPDARIHTPGLTVVIETKRHDELDNAQFKCHWSNLTNTTEHTILLSLTNARATPAVVTHLADTTPNPLLTAKHLSWSTVLQLICALQEDFEQHTATWLLLSQFEAYLRSEGYYYLEGSIVDDLIEYGDLLMKVAQHEEHTRKQLKGHLDRLKDAVMSHDKIMPLQWRSRIFHGAGRASTHRVNFTFLTAEVPLLPHANYRILPRMTKAEGLGLDYYFTYARGQDYWHDIIEWLTQHKAEVTRDCGEIFRFGLLPGDSSVFHLCRRLSPEDATRFFKGDATHANALGKEIAQYFVAVNRWIGQATQAVGATVAK